MHIAPSIKYAPSPRETIVYSRSIKLCIIFLKSDIFGKIFVFGKIKKKNLYKNSIQFSQKNISNNSFIKNQTKQSQNSRNLMERIKKKKKKNEFHRQINFSLFVRSSLIQQSSEQTTRSTRASASAFSRSWELGEAKKKQNARGKQRTV